jgi:hypothetical protein
MRQAISASAITPRLGVKKEMGNGRASRHPFSITHHPGQRPVYFHLRSTPMSPPTT